MLLQALAANQLNSRIAYATYKYTYSCIAWAIHEMHLVHPQIYEVSSCSGLILELSAGPDDDLFDVILYYIEKPIRKIELRAYSLRVMPDVDFRI